MLKSAYELQRQQHPLQGEEEAVEKVVKDMAESLYDEAFQVGWGLSGCCGGWEAAGCTF